MTKSDDAKVNEVLSALHPPVKPLTPSPEAMRAWSESIFHKLQEPSIFAQMARTSAQPKASSAQARIDAAKAQHEAVERARIDALRPKTETAKVKEVLDALHPPEPGTQPSVRSFDDYMDSMRFSLGWGALKPVAMNDFGVIRVDGV